MPRTTKTAAGPARKSRAFSLPGISDKRSDVRNTPLTPTQRLDMLCRVIERLTLENDDLRAQVRELQGPADQADELQQRVNMLEADLRQSARRRHDLERSLHDMIRERERGMREARTTARIIPDNGVEVGPPGWLRGGIGDVGIDPAMLNRIDPAMVRANTITTTQRAPMYQYWTSASTMAQQEAPAPDEPNVGEQQQ